MRTRIALLVVFLMLSAACAPLVKIHSPIPSQPALAAATPVPTATVTSLPTATETPTLTPTPSETPTPTPPPATIDPLLTATPGIAATLTAVFSTPGAQGTFVAKQTMMAATIGALLPGFSDLLSQCPNPSDPPMQNWVDIPVMPQATAGQVVQTLIGSYYCFRIPVTIGQVESFYKDKLTPSGWSLMSDVNGQMMFIGYSQAGIQQLFLISGPGNKNDLIVALNVTNPLIIPTPKK
jgi:hypothetical protein